VLHFFAHYRYFLNAQSGLSDALNLENKQKIKNLRFKAYIHQRKALPALFRRLGNPAETLIYLGDGYSRGAFFMPRHHPSPKGNSLRRELVNAGFTVKMTKEYNTSQVSYFQFTTLTLRYVLGVFTVQILLN
jgi:hypothetical protein